MGKTFKVKKLELIHWRLHGEQIQLITWFYYRKMFSTIEAKDLSEVKIFLKQSFCFDAYLHSVRVNFGSFTRFQSPSLLLQ